MFFIIFSSFLLFIIIRILQKIRTIYSLKKIDKDLSIQFLKKINIIIVFGSGGHTTEMLMLFKNYDFINRCDLVHFIRAESDKSS